MFSFNAKNLASIVYTFDYGNYLDFEKNLNPDLVPSCDLHGNIVHKKPYLIQHGF